MLLLMLCLLMLLLLLLVYGERRLADQQVPHRLPLLHRRGIRLLTTIYQLPITNNRYYLLSTTY